jgi:hypothetical protein
MYIPVVMTESYRVVRRGDPCQEIEEAKKAAKELPIDKGQMPAVIDSDHLVRWKGGIKVARRAVKNSP